MTERTAVIVPAPTPNGDLHIGHLAGPFLASDVYARYLRATGTQVLYSTGTQDNQTYVVTSARRLGTTPRELAAKSSKEIQHTLDALGISVDGFAASDERFEKLLLDFLGTLHARGKFRLRELNFPYSARTRSYLVDAYVQGACPTCLAWGGAGVCESCGHPVDGADLIDPRSTECPDETLELRPVPVLVLPLEDYRPGLEAYFARVGHRMRPHMAQAIRELMAKPLPDFPITWPTSWGTPAPFPEVPGQVINPSTEAMPGGMFSTALAGERRDIEQAYDDELWLAGTGTTVTYFCGFDNVAPFAIAGIAFLLAHGNRYVLPELFVTNEFYELDNEKVSTSRGHVVWGSALAAEVPRDLIRFYLATTSPEHQRTNFSRDALTHIAASRLVGPWNRVVDKVNAITGAAELPISAESHRAARLMVDRFTACYAPDSFSLNRAAETITTQLARLDELVVPPGDFCYEVEVFLRCAAPVLIDLAACALPDVAFPGVAPDLVTPRRLPKLISRMA
jgi:methionyl-tRNA synthetase